MKPMPTILVVDDEPNYLVVLSELLRDEGFEIFTAPGTDDAMRIVRDADLDLVITDMQMPEKDGTVLMGQVKDFNADLPVIIITAYDPRMIQIYELIEKVAPTNASVLITGESGTGKEMVAKSIHVNSPRETHSFVTVNCAALNESMLDSELFGHEQGAVSEGGALRKGRFETANLGTIFLDEIGEIPLSIQSKLLRILQEKNFERVGGTQTIEVDVRIISATNKDLKEEVQLGRFREDLFYRLNVIHLGLPALRDRMDDIPLLVDHFLKNCALNLGKEHLSISPEALRLLVNLPWEGNVRELENTIERAAILCNNDKIEAGDVQPESVSVDKNPQWSREVDILNFIPDSVELNDVLYTVEERMLNRALEKSGHVQARAAEMLGITKSLLQYKMKKYGIKKQK